MATVARGWVLGEGGGPLGRVRPPVRIIFGLTMIAAVLAAPRDLGVGSLYLLGIAASIGLAAGAPARLVVRALGFGALLYLPLSLVLAGAAFLGAGDSSVGDALVAALSISIKGCVILLTALSVASTIRLSEFHAAVAGLPLPHLTRLLLLQIVQQTAALLSETARIRQAIALRTPGKGGSASARILFAFPRVWLERVTARAERTALGLDMRGYIRHGADPLPPLEGWRRADTVALAAGVLALGIAFALRLQG